MRTDFFLPWLCVGIHGDTLALLIRDKKDGIRNEYYRVAARVKH